MTAPGYRVSRMRRLRRSEDGAAAVEFALIGPLLFFLILGLIYILLLGAAQVSLGYATNVGVRHAAIGEPSVGEIIDRATESTPFFSSDRCTAIYNHSGVANQPVTLTMNCNFPNPAGGAADAFRRAMHGGGSEISSTIAMSATAQSRKE